jgi:hypothetical protein
MNNKIEFLLDMAEMHLRDAAICGYEFKVMKSGASCVPSRLTEIIKRSFRAGN